MKIKRAELAQEISRTLGRAAVVELYPAQVKQEV